MYLIFFFFFFFFNLNKKKNKKWKPQIVVRVKIDTHRLLDFFFFF